jgi:cell division protein FtsB
LEFSFDSRSRGSEASAAPQGGNANDRLRKAIERNRAKQAKRDAMGQTAANTGMSAPPQDAPLFSTSSTPRQAAGGGLSSRLRSSDGSVPQRPKSRLSSSRLRPAANADMGMQEAPEAPAPTREDRGWGKGLLKKKVSSAKSSLTPTRKNVAKAGEAEFVAPVRKAVAKAPAKVGYATAKRKVNTRKKNAESNYIGYLVKFGWAFCTFLLFRLVFSGGGVMDYYSSLNLLEDKQYEFTRIIEDNKNLAVEIKKISTNSTYQKKLVRDNLGFIARDEYLILFPREKSL